MSSMMMLLVVCLMMVCWMETSCGFQLSSRSLARPSGAVAGKSLLRSAQPIVLPSASMRLWSSEDDSNVATGKDDATEDTVKKYGLEAGMLKAATEKDSKVKPKDLFAKYGIAYLMTSITLALISYGLCYVLIANGVDVPKLLEKIGIESTQMAASTGTAALAYAVHKAASPIRFPPTVALTPVVARWLGNRNAKKNEE